MAWQKAAALSELENGPVMFKSPPRQIALFGANGKVFAIDNRCPHEGYPLVEGRVDENCVLTCVWHNWKFRLQDGECILGGDHVRSYPVKQEDGFVWVNVVDPPQEELQRQVAQGLKTAFQERDYGRICREITRLHYYNIDPLLSVSLAVQWSYDRLEFGFMHCYAAAADWIALAQSLQANGEGASTGEETWEKQLICLAEAVDHIAFDALRHPVYPFAQAQQPFERQAFLDAVEQEQVQRAEGMMGRALQEGAGWEELEEPLTAAALAHYNDFGHALIYVLKAGELISLLGVESRRPLLLALTRHLCYTTREDLLPPFADYAPVLQSVCTSERNADADGHHQRAGALEEPFGRNTRQALKWVADHWSTHAIGEIYDALLCGLARNLLHFDVSVEAAYDRPVSDNVGWLDLTHGLTFSNAVRRLCGRHPHLWPAGLLQMACFLGRNRKYLGLSVDENLWRVEDAGEFFEEVTEQVLDHGLRDPIFSAHLIKTSTAVQEELALASPRCRELLLAGLRRFLQTPMKQKHARRLALQAIELVKRDF